jgi:hypothetical protein
MTTSQFTLMAVAVSIISSGSAFATNSLSAARSEGCPNYESFIVTDGSCPATEQGIWDKCTEKVDKAYSPPGTCTVNEDGNTCMNYPEDGYYLTCNLQS